MCTVRPASVVTAHTQAPKEYKTSLCQCQSDKRNECVTITGSGQAPLTLQCSLGHVASGRDWRAEQTGIGARGAPGMEARHWPQHLHARQ